MTERLRKLNDLLYLHTLEHHACWDEKYTYENYVKLKKEVLQALKIQDLLKKINIEKLIEVVHQMDLKTPVVANSRQYFVDTHYQLAELLSLIKRPEK